MINYQSMVRDFHQKMGIPIRHEVTPLTLKEWQLRHDLLVEEYTEYRDSFHIVDVADAFADMIYVILGTCIQMGIDMDEVFNEVHQSNMTKKKTNVRGDGKILKDEDFIPPDLLKALNLEEDIKIIKQKEKK